MKILKTIADRLRYITTKKEERGQYSSGYWPLKVRQQAIKLCAGREGSLLEAGCGEGLFLAGLAQGNQSLKIWGIDNWEGILRKTKERINGLGVSNVRLLRADSRKMPFPPESFDTVVCINMLFNLASFNEVTGVIQELSRVAQKGGKVIIDIRNLLNPLVFVKYKLAKFYDPSLSVPVNAHRIKRVEAALRCCNLIVEKKIPLGARGRFIAPVLLIQARKGKD